MNSKRSMIAAPIAIILIVAGFLAVQRARPKRLDVLTQKSLQKDTGTPVDVVSPTRRTVNDALAVTGQLAADSTTSLSTKVQGKVVSVAAREGDTVTAGQVVIQLDDSDALNQLAQARAGVQQAQAGLRVAQARLSQARTGQQVGDVQSNTAVAAARAGLQSARARLEMVTTGARKQERLQAENAVAIAKASYDKAQSDFRRYKGLADQGAVSASTLDAYQTALDVARSQYNNAVQAASLVQEGARTEDVRQAEAAVRQAEESLRGAQAAQGTKATRREDVNAAMAGVATAQAAMASARASLGIALQNVDNFKIRSPRTGAVTMRAVEPGQYASPGQPLLTIVDLGTVYFQADVSETDIARVKPGQVVSVSVDALPDRTWNGRIVSIVASADAASRSFTTKVVVGNPDRTLRPNMFARGQIVTGRVVDALLVPKEAVISKQEKYSVVRVVNGAAEIVPVSVGISVDDSTVVRSAKLSVKDKIVVTGQQDLTNGQKVSVSEGG